MNSTIQTAVLVVCEDEKSCKSIGISDLNFSTQEYESRSHAIMEQKLSPRLSETDEVLCNINNNDIFATVTEDNIELKISGDNDGLISMIDRHSNNSGSKNSHKHNDIMCIDNTCTKKISQNEETFNVNNNNNNDNNNNSNNINDSDEIIYIRNNNDVSFYNGYIYNEEEENMDDNGSVFSPKSDISNESSNSNCNDNCMANTSNVNNDNINEDNWSCHWKCIENDDKMDICQQNDQTSLNEKNLSKKIGNEQAESLYGFVLNSINNIDNNNNNNNNSNNINNDNYNYNWYLDYLKWDSQRKNVNNNIQYQISNDNNNNNNKLSLRNDFLMAMDCNYYNKNLDESTMSMKCYQASYVSSQSDNDSVSTDSSITCDDYQLNSNFDLINFEKTQSKRKNANINNNNNNNFNNKKERRYDIKAPNNELFHKYAKCFQRRQPIITSIVECCNFPNVNVTISNAHGIGITSSNDINYEINSNNQSSKSFHM